MHGGMAVGLCALWRSQKTSLSGLSATSSACFDSTAKQGQLIPHWRWDQLPCLHPAVKAWAQTLTKLMYCNSICSIWFVCSSLTSTQHCNFQKTSPAIIFPSSDRVLQDPLQLKGQLVCTKTSEKCMEVDMGIEERAAPTFQHWNITHLAAPSHCLTFPEQALQGGAKHKRRLQKKWKVFFVLLRKHLMIAFTPLSTWSACSLFSRQVLRDEALVSSLIKNQYQMLGDNV